MGRRPTLQQCPKIVINVSAITAVRFMLFAGQPAITHGHCDVPADRTLQQHPKPRRLTFAHSIRSGGQPTSVHGLQGRRYAQAPRRSLCRNIPSLKRNSNALVATILFSMSVAGEPAGVHGRQGSCNVQAARRPPCSSGCARRSGSRRRRSDARAPCAGAKLKA